MHNKANTKQVVHVVVDDARAHLSITTKSTLKSVLGSAKSPSHHSASLLVGRSLLLL